MRLPLFELRSAAFHLSAWATEPAPSDVPPCGFRPSGCSVRLAPCGAIRTGSGLLPADFLRNPHPLRTSLSCSRPCGFEPSGDHLPACAARLWAVQPLRTDELRFTHNRGGLELCVSISASWPFRAKLAAPLTVKLAAPSQLIRKVLCFPVQSGGTISLKKNYVNENRQVKLCKIVDDCEKKESAIREQRSPSGKSKRIPAYALCAYLQEART